MHGSIGDYFSLLTPVGARSARMHFRDRQWSYRSPVLVHARSHEKASVKIVQCLVHPHLLVRRQTIHDASIADIEHQRITRRVYEQPLNRELWIRPDKTEYRLCL